MWNDGYLEKNSHRIDFPIMLNMTSCTSQWSGRCHYQLAGVIAHVGFPRMKDII
jgi:hypothetical protein